MNSRAFQVIIIFTLCLLKIQSIAQPKTDTVYFQHGDKITCEIKSLKNNILYVKTNDAGTIEIKWDKVDSLFVLQTVVIETINGEEIAGNLSPIDSAKHIGIYEPFGSRIIPLIDIVKMFPYQKKFLNRISGSLASGFSYSQANELAIGNIMGKITYQEKNYSIQTDYSGEWSNQKNGESAERHYFSGDFTRKLRRKYFLKTFLSGERNSELQLDLRSNLGIVLGNNIVYSNKVITRGGIGFQVNQENSNDTIAYNLEGMVALEYDFFRHSSPKVELSVRTHLIPSFTDFKRYRLNFNSELRWELFKDFFLKYSFFYTYDRKPLSLDAKKQDWSVSLGLEYTFN